MKITFSPLDSIEKYAKDADVFICLADANKHPCHTKKFNTEWAKKEFFKYEVNDKGVDHRYNDVTFDDILLIAEGIFMTKVFKPDAWLHINCLAGYSRSPAITLLALLLNQEEEPTLKDYQKYYAELQNGVYRLPPFPTEPNQDICKFIRQYFNLEVTDGEFSQKQ